MKRSLKLLSKSPLVFFLFFFAFPLLYFSSLNFNASSNDISKDKILKPNIVKILLLFGFLLYKGREMKFWPSTKNNIGLVEERKNQQSSGSSRIKVFFQFFAKKTFFSHKKKFLPPPSTVTFLSLLSVFKTSVMISCRNGPYFVERNGV
jgi:hypothetical protein